MPTRTLAEIRSAISDTSLWRDIDETMNDIRREVAAELQKLKAEHETIVVALTADRDRIAKLLADASAAFDAGDIATLATMRATALQTESEKKLATALAKKAEAEAEIAALKE
jgi:hypothetical protein